MDTFLPLREQTPSSELQSIIQVMTEPSNGILPEFAFVIAQLARDYLDMKHLSA
jgi:hypothetical protein